MPAGIRCGWPARRYTPGNNPDDPIAWKGVGQAIPPNSPFIALTGDYGYRLMYYGWREPAVIWPGEDTLDMQQAHGNSPLDYPSYFASETHGMDYFLVTAFSTLDQQPQLKAILYGHYPIYKQGDGYILFDLKHPTSSP